MPARLPTYMHVCSTIITLLLFAFISVATGSFLDLVGVIVFAFTPIFAFEALASRQDGFAYCRRFGIFCRRGGAHGFFLRRGDESRECIQVATGHGFLLSLSTFGLDCNTILCRRRRQMVGLCNRAPMTSNASRPRLEVNVPIKASPPAKSSTSVAVSVPTLSGSPSPAPSLLSMNPTLK